MKSSGNAIGKFVRHREQVKKSNGPFLLIRYCLMELNSDGGDLSYAEWFVVEREGRSMAQCSAPGRRSKVEHIADRLNEAFLAAGHSYTPVTRFHTAQMAYAKGSYKAMRRTTFTVDANYVETMAIEEWVQGPNGPLPGSEHNTIAVADSENEREAVQKVLLANADKGDTDSIEQPPANSHPQRGIRLPRSKGPGS